MGKQTICEKSKRHILNENIFRTQICLDPRKILSFKIQKITNDSGAIRNLRPLKTQRVSFR